MAVDLGAKYAELDALESFKEELPQSSPAQESSLGNIFESLGEESSSDTEDSESEEVAPQKKSDKEATTEKKSSTEKPDSVEKEKSSGSKKDAAPKKAASTDKGKDRKGFIGKAVGAVVDLLTDALSYVMNLITKGKEYADKFGDKMKQLRSDNPSRESVQREIDALKEEIEKEEAKLKSQERGEEPEEDKGFFAQIFKSLFLEKQNEKEQSSNRGKSTKNSFNEQEIPKEFAGKNLPLSSQEDFQQAVKELRDGKFEDSPKGTSSRAPSVPKVNLGDDGRDGESHC